MDKKVLTQKGLPLLVFLSLEVMLFIVSNFADSLFFLKGISILIFLLLIPFYWKDIKNDFSKGLFDIIIPLVFYGFVVALAPSYGTGDAALNVLNFTIFQKIINLLSLVSIALTGYLIRKSKLFSSHAVYLVILCGLALPVFISLIATLINYGFFHTLLYKNKVVFYEGQAYNLSQQVSFLYGFGIHTVSVNVLTTSGLLLASIGLALVFLSKNIKKHELIIFVVIAFIGISSLVLTGTFLALLFLLPSVVFLLIIKFNLMRYLKLKPVKFTLLGLAVAGVLIFVLTAFNVGNIQDFLSQNVITRKLLLNSYFKKFYVVLVEAISFRNITGTYYMHYTDYSKVFPTGNVLFDVMWMDGLFGFLAVAAFIILFIRVLVKNYKFGSEDKMFKIALICGFLTIFTAYMLIYPYNQFVYDELSAYDKFPLINSTVFLSAVFFSGFLNNVEITEVKK